MNNKIFTILENGVKISYDVILTFKSEKTHKNYVVYTDNSLDEDNKLKIYAAIYNPDTFEFIATVDTTEEWIEINKILEKVL
ncbi:MAG: DUF1292 domain-containing protein [Bacilli bacterium]|nr:DUF1292 domain-containing protein [Bacilli bacterium]